MGPDDTVRPSPATHDGRTLHELLAESDALNARTPGQLLAPPTLARDRHGSEGVLAAPPPPAKAVEHSREEWRFDCEQTLSDEQIIYFVETGFLRLPACVAPVVNQQTIDWLNGAVAPAPAWVPRGLTGEEQLRIWGSHEPTTLFLEDWFLRGVLLQPVLAGVLRSLLGPNVGLPAMTSLHPAESFHRARLGASPAAPAQGFHQDGPDVRPLCCPAPRRA
eukprot:COSAG06_NODE_8514_length_2143_cov_3.738748_1_plen_220_part_00